jgi:hypothetical protein
MGHGISACVFPVALKAGGGCEFALGYNQGAGTQNGTATLTDSSGNQAGSTQAAVLTLRYPASLLSAASFDFGTGGVGGAAGFNFLTIANQGQASLLIGGLNFSGTNSADFQIADNSCTNVVSPG